MPELNDPDAQLAMLQHYIRERYGSAVTTKRFWPAHGWYEPQSVLAQWPNEDAWRRASRRAVIQRDVLTAGLGLAAAVLLWWAVRRG